MMETISKVAKVPTAICLGPVRPQVAQVQRLLRTSQPGRRFLSSRDSQSLVLVEYKWVIIWVEHRGARNTKLGKRPGRRDQGWTFSDLNLDCRFLSNLQPACQRREKLLRRL